MAWIYQEQVLLVPIVQARRGTGETDDDLLYTASITTDQASVQADLERRGI